MKYKSKLITFIFIILLGFYSSNAQQNNTLNSDLVAYESNDENPFGKPNKNAPEQIRDFEKFIGVCNCKSVQYSGNGVGDTLALKWRWKYILNGNAIQDDGWFGNESSQTAFTSIRILNPQTKQWQVPFFTPYMISEPQIWNGGKEGENIVLRKPEAKQNNDHIESVLTFSNITENGFNWTGKIVNLDSKKETVFWRIWCVKEL
nr:hypothetical protein [uncultured Psychroserpens sp.]